MFDSHFVRASARAKKKFAKVYWQTLNKHEDIKRESIKLIYKTIPPRWNYFI